MALTTVRYGRYKSASEADYGTISAGQMRACVFDAASDNIWVVKLGAWMGKSGGGNATARLALYDTDGSKNPDDRAGYSASVTVSTAMAGPGGGASYEPDVAVSDNGPTNDAIMVRSGHRYAVAILATSAGVGHSMRESAAISADNEQFYDRSGLSQPPPDPFGAYSSAIEGHLTAWAEGYVNEAPLAPSSLAPSGTIDETAPTFTATFRDRNGAYGDSSGSGVDTGDQVNEYTIQLRAVGTTTLLWNTTYSGNGTERSTDALSRAYGGSALSRGTAYEWRIRASDEFGAWGAWSAWTSFTPASLGYVTLDADPTGKIEETTPDFQGRWTHQSGTSMKRVQVRLLSWTGELVLQTGADFNIADVASAASPGTLFTVPWADTGFTTLAWGKQYRYQIRGYDGSQWSDWSASRLFNTDAAPSIPSRRAPASGTLTTNAPLLAFAMTDSDDTTGSGLTGIIRISRPDASTADVTATYNATTGKWEFQTTGTELTAYGTYSWKATGYDGTLYSGEATALGSATWSAANTFVYAAGPTVTLTAPLSNDTLTTAGFPVTWTVSTTQVRYKVAILPAGDTTPVYQSNGGDWTVSATGSHDVPAGYVVNGQVYDIAVAVEDTTPLTGSATVIDVLIDYPPPDPVANLQATAVAIGTDPAPTAIRLSWDQTAYATPEFVEYIVTRYADGGPDTAETVLARLTSPAAVALIDYTPASGYEYCYGVRVVTLTGVDQLESEPVEASASVDLAATVLTLHGNGGTYRANLTNVRERDETRAIDEAVYQPLSRAQPTTVRARTRYWAANLEAALIATDDATAAQHKAALEALDAQGGTVVVRHADGTKRFAALSGLQITYQHGGWYAVKLALREERASEGEPA